MGLVRGHAYSVTKVVKARIETPRVSGEIPLVRVRNPWGNEVTKASVPPPSAALGGVERRLVGRLG